MYIQIKMEFYQLRFIYSLQSQPYQQNLFRTNLTFINTLMSTKVQKVTKICFSDDG